MTTTKALLDSIQRFLYWTHKKIAIHSENKPPFFCHERDLWWASFGENIGSEANGKHANFERPVLIIKKFSSNMLFVIPTTTQSKTGSWYQPLEYAQVKSYAVLSQARAISTKRRIRKIGSVPVEQHENVVRAFMNLIKTEPPT